MLAAFLPQLVVFHMPFFTMAISDDVARVILVTTQAVLLVFVWLNRNTPGFFALGLGLLLNFAVIVANGGLMPISPEIVGKYLPDGDWQVGSRMGGSKDIILPVHQTRLYWLSDRFTLPDWIPYRVAYSIGDLLMSIGAFWLLWSVGSPQKYRKEEVVT